jgi:hypothetical protein
MLAAHGEELGILKRGEKANVHSTVHCHNFYGSSLFSVGNAVPAAAEDQ